MFKKLNAEKEKFIANINPLIIYIVALMALTLSIISCDRLYAVEKESRLIWAVITIAITMLEWLVALIGFYSYIYAFKYDVKKPIILVIVCYLLIILGIVSFYLVTKIMP